ncbi:glucokinase [Sphingomonas sp.]|uniref:glucokinase n=1 Tax=Sphingomonas sp. TaxID=28214 RepID=UPI002B5215C2|nr:glucokinase [Sphingomonas sp.]HTG37821.1 glucokinase [Sphingomonas sp.]
MGFMVEDGEAAIVGHVGRTGLRFARVDGEGQVDMESLCFHPAASSTSISGAIATFLRDQGLQGRAIRAAIAVAGLIRGDTISVTHTRWFVSRPGLEAMLGHPPLLLNDFEAEAWAFAQACQGDAAMARSGTWCIAGITSGLGVSVLRRDAGRTTVIATEAGHAAFSPPNDDLAALVAEMFPGQHAVPAELLISAPGLIAIYAALSAHAGQSARLSDPKAITAARKNDPLAARACALLAQAFWGHLSNLVLAYGAWDGVIATGGLALALQDLADQPDCVATFTGKGKYARLLSEMPRRFERVEHGVLTGAAAALRSAAPPERTTRAEVNASAMVPTPALQRMRPV